MSRNDLAERAPGDARPGKPGLGIVEKGAVAARGGRIAFAGPEDELPAALRDRARIVDCEGRWITPGFIDCHTHLVYGGDRAGEFEMRLAGASYEEIAQSRRRHPLDRAGDARGERRGSGRFGAARASTR